MTCRQASLEQGHRRGSSVGLKVVQEGPRFRQAGCENRGCLGRKGSQQSLSIQIVRNKYSPKISASLNCIKQPFKLTNLINELVETALNNSIRCVSMLRI